MLEICLYSHLYLAFLVMSEHLFIGEPAWKCVTSPSSVYARVCTSVRLRAHPREKWNTAIAFKKNNVFFFVFVAYPTQNVVKTRIPLDKSVSVAPDFVAYLTCQPCLCKQTAFLHGWAEQSRTRNKVHTQNQSVSTPRKERATLE